MTGGEVIAAISGVVIAVLTFLGGRFTTRSARNASREDKAVKWERKYRRGAEAHIRWDTMMVAEFRRLQYRVQDLEQKNGLDPSPVVELPDPPPLFPEDDEKEE